MKAIVYKINNCSFCQQAVQLLEDNNIQVTEKYLESKSHVEEFKKDCPGKTTVPQIFIERKYIGNYEQLKKIDLKQLYINWCLTQ